MPEYYSIKAEDAFKLLKSSAKGLDNSEAGKRLEQHGFNELPKEKGITAFQILVAQFNNILSWILISAGILSLFLGEYMESAAMFFIVIINAILGFVQEYKADRALKALQKISAPSARVLRSGKEERIPARELVPGDIILLEAGDIVPADSRVFEESSLKIDEAALTGESFPSPKITAPFKEGTSVADQENMAFMGTVVIYGKGRSIVSHTGQNTEFGKIAKSIQSVEESGTPLQKKFAALSKQIGIIAVFLILAVLALGTLKGTMPFTEMLLISLALAVATIPVALPTIVTIGLSVGSKKLSRENMIIKKLAATESLGSATIICTDKTGTLTRNEMTITKLYFDGKVFDVTGAGYDPKGEFLVNDKKTDPAGLEIMMRIGLLCNNSKITKNGAKYGIIGDPTEGSLAVLAHKAGFEKFDKIDTIIEFPFDSERKMMSIVVKDKKTKETYSYIKGACDLILDNCTKTLDEGKERKLTKEDKLKILSVNNSFGKSALRVLALAYKKIPESKKYTMHDAETGLVFAGLVGMIDPPRDMVKEAIRQCHDAGIGVMIITGDHAITAQAIAEQISVFGKGDLVLTGEELEKMSDKELKEKISRVRIVARALPIQKSRIVDSLKGNGHVVIMTGDGVNDAPALKKSDIGVAMGITGTDVAKEVSKGILADDNFVTIVKAIKSGRNIYDQMIKSAKYLLACNVGEVFTILTSILISIPLPLIPLQILLINLLTDALPAIGLGMEQAEPGIMSRPPRNPRERPLSNKTLVSIIFFGIVMAAGTLFMFMRYSDTNLIKAQTVAFTTLVMFQLFAVMSSRTLSFSLSSFNPFSNRVLLICVLASVLIQLLAVYWSPMQKIFGTVGLQLGDWILILAVSSLGFLVMEASKIALNWRSKGISVSGPGQ